MANDFSEAIAFFDKALAVGLPKSLNTRKLVSDAAQLGLARIKVRTGQGKDVEGKVFAGYAPGTVVTRARAGRGKVVDLFFKGELMAGVVAKTVSSEEARVVVAPPEQDKALGHQLGLGNLPVRKWFGLSTTGDAHTLRAIDKLAAKALEKAIKSL